MLRPVTTKPSCTLLGMTVQAHLDLLKRAAKLETLSRTVEPIHDAIETLNTWVVKGNVKPAAEELVLDGADQELDEALLGVGFVACQAGMAHVASRARNLALFCKDNGIAALTGWDGKDAIYKLDKELCHGGPSRMFFLNAVANYFKHRDEWPDIAWANLAGQSLKTAQTVSCGGLSYGAKDNLRKATSALDDGIFDAVKEWGAGLVERAEKELAPHL